MENLEGTRPYVGCAGWSLPKQSLGEFIGDGTHLERYATRFNAVEINSSFYRPHQQKTYARWAESVPDSFRFSVKVPKAITHTARLETTAAVIGKFVDEVSGLGQRLGCWLVQLPPSLRLETKVASAFFELFHKRSSGCAAAIVCEPRHATWFTPSADQLLADFGVARVAADPAVVPAAGQPGGASHVIYVRLHGSPRMYYSAYSDAQIADVARVLQRSVSDSQRAWCIFDNTADGAATTNALRLRAVLQSA